MNEININNITKKYSGTIALDNINLTIEPGKIYGLLGRNGAGKTTLLNLITNRIFPTSGNITINGIPVIENDDILRQVFFMTEKNLYPESMKVHEIFRWTREFYKSFDLNYANELSKKFDLNTNKKIKALSTGYASIFKAILALASRAPIKIFDEPVLGLDANHRAVLYREIIASYNEAPGTIIVSTHLIEEVAELLEEVIIIKQGRLIVKSPVEELLSNAYQISGEASKVEEYIKGKKCAGEEIVGKFKAVTVLEGIDEKNRELAKRLELDVTKAELQKLFINLTNE